MTLSNALQMIIKHSRHCNSWGKLFISWYQIYVVLKVLPSCYENLLFPKQSDGKGPKCGDIFLCMADDKNRKLWPQWPLVIVWHGFNSIQIYSPPPLYLTIHFKLFFYCPANALSALFGPKNSIWTTKWWRPQTCNWVCFIFCCSHSDWWLMSLWNVAAIIEIGSFANHASRP